MKHHPIAQLSEAGKKALLAPRGLTYDLNAAARERLM